MKKKMAALGMSAALLAGGAAGAVAMAPSMASAESDAASSTASGDTAEAKAPGAWVTDALSGLVDDGTLTQAQADAVKAALEEARPAGGPGGRGGPGMGHGRGPGLEAAAAALGIEASALRTELQAGKTIAEVAEANDVDVQKVIDAIVAEMSEHLAEAVENGRLTQAEADERSANAEERATALVNGERPERPDMPADAPADS